MQVPLAFIACKPLLRKTSSSAFIAAPENAEKKTCILGPFLL